MYSSDSRAAFGKVAGGAESGDDDPVFGQGRRVVVRRFFECFVLAALDADDFDLPGGGFHLELIGRKAAVAGIDINMQRGETHAGPTGRIFLLRLLCQDGDYQTNAGQNDWRYFAHYKTPLSRRTAARATTSTSLRSIRPSPLMSHSVSAGPADSICFANLKASRMSTRPFRSISTACVLLSERRSVG